jgi:hypothetical protein
LQKSHQANAPRQTRNDNNKHDRKEGQLVTAVWRNGGCSASYDSFVVGSSAVLRLNFCANVKQNIKGEATATYVLGIGGLAKETLVDNAKQQMLASTPLKSNQTLANLTVNFKSSFYLGVLFRTVTCTVTADVVEFK